MGMTFGAWSGNREDVLEFEVNCGGSTHFRLQRCLGLQPEESGDMELEVFSAKLNAAVENWGPDNPGYPEQEYIEAYGRGPEYILYWLEELQGMCSRARDAGLPYVSWF